jgi:hypothetical protein
MMKANFEFAVMFGHGIRRGRFYPGSVGGRSSLTLDIELYRFVRVGIALLALIHLGGCSREADQTPRQLSDQYARSGLALREGAHALELSIILSDLREGRVTNAMELLEQRLDTAVIALGTSMPKIDTTEQQRAQGVLHAVKGYRMKYPRQREAVFSDMEEHLASQLDQVREAAGRILDQVE